MKDKGYYIKLRNKFKPTKIKLIFIAESPPVSCKYFYDPKGLVSEPLFKALMKNVLNTEFSSKEEGLKVFKKAGYFLIDATYHQVNKYSRSKRNKIIIGDFKYLITDLKRINPTKKYH